MSDAENPTEATEVQVTPEVKAPPVIQPPTATGNDQIAILRHDLFEADLEQDEVSPTFVEFAIRNVSDAKIASAFFEAEFCDAEGHILETIRFKEVEIDPNTSRGVRVTTSIPQYQYDTIKRYDVRVVRTTTADVEKVQVRRHETLTAETGEEAVKGIVKNISDVVTDAAVVVTFHDTKNQNIGTRVVILRDLQPSAIRQYGFRFRPQAGDTVTSYSVVVGEIVE